MVKLGLTLLSFSWSLCPENPPIQTMQELGNMFGAKVSHGGGVLAWCGVVVTLALTGCGKKEEALLVEAQPAPQPLIASRYRPSADGSEITDTQTGLTWQRCSVGQRWSGSSCEGEAKIFTFGEALAQAGNGWRVPTVREFQSLRVCSTGFEAKTLDFQDGKAKVSYACSYGSARPTIHTGAFPNTPLLHHWASPLLGDSSDSAWSVVFYDGSLGLSGRGYGHHVRLVR
ncbi:hypothetical protein VITFI_CDS1679 [Vitreoscilla filiformis]|uniref:Lcl C-terminal domain-containing protein n=1 Tax=Vitreoscilla filiformis TaxID=63 RepID=A0A221KF33_VITFI|nr:DUF1566 domain-containing protein [Vitreoscilla filiformis]ASM77457.1 hypothetical protein VITFI_CDS1679 [Vitreoscilla filiformis]